MTRSLLTLLSAASVLFLASCGGGGYASNEYLGELPGMAEKYEKKIEALEEKVENTTDINKAFKYDKEAEQLDDEAEEKMEAYSADKDWSPLPFEASDGLTYTIEEIRVERASFNSLHLQMDVTFSEVPTNKYGGAIRDIFGYLQGLDADGNRLEGKAVLAMRVDRKSPIEPGKKYTLKGQYQHIEQLQNFAKFHALNADEYKELAGL